MQWGASQCFGYELDGELIGAVIFTEYSGNDMQVTVVTTNPIWWTRRNIRAMYDYVWNKCGCVRLSALCKESNAKSQKLLRGLGFQEEGRLRKYFNPEDGIVFGQLRSECRWI
jgi:RimJ/RimL family protein N-acetyltransferase